MILREPTPEEAKAFLRCPFEPGFARVAIEGGEVIGYVCASVIEGHAWVHELHCWGPSQFSESHTEMCAVAVFRMIRAAVRVIRSWGFEDIFVNTYNSRVKEFLEKRGFGVSQFILKGSADSL